MPALRARRDSLDEIDMDRVVADPDYRRSVIIRLKRERLLARAETVEDDQDAAADDD